MGLSSTCPTHFRHEFNTVLYFTSRNNPRNSTINEIKSCVWLLLCAIYIYIYTCQLYYQSMPEKKTSHSTARYKTQRTRSSYTYPAFHGEEEEEEKKIHFQRREIGQSFRANGSARALTLSQSSSSLLLLLLSHYNSRYKNAFKLPRFAPSISFSHI